MFAGWTGDTTAQGDSLNLIMQHPFNLLANFVAVHAVQLSNAADALFGTSQLLSEEAAYLDAVGNNNLVETCINAIRPGGTAVMVGVPRFDEQLNLPALFLLLLGAAPGAAPP